MRAYYAANRQRIRAQQTAYIKANPVVARLRKHRYRARRALAVGRFTAAEWLALLESHGAFCEYCGTTGDLSADHRVPLSRGGSNTIDNITPACRLCNSRKRHRTDVEYRALISAARSPFFANS